MHVDMPERPSDSYRRKPLLLLLTISPTKVYIFKFINMSMKQLSIFKALSDETRFRIVCCLIGCERCACVIPEIVGRAQPTVSLQLKKLVKLGVLNARREGRWMKYSIRDRMVLDILAVVGGMEQCSKK